MRFRLWVCLLLMTTLPTAIGCGLKRQTDDDRRNVILISIDSLRSDHVGCYGYDKPTTPALDAFAMGAVRFTDSYSTAPWTLPSHASMFTGLYPDTHHATKPQVPMDTNNVTLAQRLSEAGYDTHAIVCAPALRSLHKINQGFAKYDEQIAMTSRNRIRQIKTSRRVTDKAIRYLKKEAVLKKPFFLFVHYWDVHYDYNPPKEYTKIFDPDYTGTIDADNYSKRNDIIPGLPERDLQHIIALYDGEIRYTDDHLAELLAFLDQSGLAKSTMVIITADHGDEFLEHGSTGHTFTCYDELIRVPLLVRVPWLKPRVQVIQNPVENVDLFPTIMSSVGLSLGERKVQGFDLLPLIERGEAPARSSLFCETRMARRYGWQGLRGIWRSRRDLDGKKAHYFQGSGREFNELYDMNADPREMTDLCRTDAEQCHRAELQLRRQHVAHDALARELSLRYMGRKVGQEQSTEEKELEEQLKGLGYLE